MTNNTHKIALTLLLKAAVIWENTANGPRVIRVELEDSPAAVAQAINASELLAACATRH